MRMGLPQVVTSDQGREFNNKLDKCLMELLGVDHRLTAPYHPQVWWFFVPLIVLPEHEWWACNLVIFLFPFFLYRPTDRMKGSIKQSKTCWLSSVRQNERLGVHSLTRVCSPITPVDTIPHGTHHSSLCLDDEQHSQLISTFGRNLLQMRCTSTLMLITPHHFQSWRENANSV